MNWGRAFVTVLGVLSTLGAARLPLADDAIATFDVPPHGAS
jgi:hypothetical protein